MLEQGKGTDCIVLLQLFVFKLDQVLRVFDSIFPKCCGWVSCSLNDRVNL